MKNMKQINLKNYNALYNSLIDITEEENNKIVSCISGRNNKKLADKIYKSVHELENPLTDIEMLIKYCSLIIRHSTKISKNIYSNNKWNQFIKAIKNMNYLLGKEVIHQDINYKDIIKEFISNKDSNGFSEALNKIYGLKSTYFPSGDIGELIMNNIIDKSDIIDKIKLTDYELLVLLRNLFDMIGMLCRNNVSHINDIEKIKDILKYHY